MKAIFSIWIIASFLLSSCSQDDTSGEIFGTWSSREVENTNDLPPLLNPEKEKTQKGEIIAIFPDGKYTNIGADGSYRTGAWEKIGNNRIELVTKSQGKLKLLLSKPSDKKQMPKLIMEVSGKENPMTFEKLFDTTADLSAEPFHPTNNEWRKKATHSENPDELKIRLLNHIRHFMLLLKKTIDSDNSILDTRYSQGPIQIYNKAIGYKPFDKISQSWINTFYDEEEARQTAIRFGNFVTNYAYEGKRAADWIKQDYYILSSIYESMK